MGRAQIPAALIGGDASDWLKANWEATGGYGKYNTSMTGIGPAKLTERPLPSGMVPEKV